MKFGIKQKLFGGFGIVLLLFIATVIIALFSVNDIDNNIDKTLNHPLTVTRAAIRIEVGITSMHRHMKDVSISETKKTRDQYIAYVADEEEKTLQQFDIVQNQALGEEGRRLVSAAREQFLDWRPIRHRVISLMEAGNFQQAQDITQTEGDKYVDGLISKLDELVTYAAGKDVAFSEESAAITNRTLIMMLSALVLSVALSLFLSIYLSVNITNRLSKINHAALKMTEGDLQQVIEVKGRDELTDIAISFNTMANQLSDSYETLEEKIVQRTQQLQETEHRLSSFMDSATDGFILFDAELNYLEINRAALDLTGMTRKECIGHNILDVAPNLKDTGRYNKYKKVVKTGKALHFSDLAPHPKFGIKNIELKAFKVGEGLGIIFSDITERKQADEALKTAKEFAENLLETANTLVVTLDSEASITTFNRYAAELTGYKRAEVIGRNWFDLFIPQSDQERIPKVFKEVLKNMPEVSQYENPIVIKGGEERLISWSNNVLRDNYGNINGVLSIGMDITASKQTEEDLKRSLAEKQTLLNEVHHRVKNNLQIVISLYDLAKMQITDQKAIDLLNENAHKIQAISLVHQQLYQSEHFDRINLKEHLERLLRHIARVDGTGKQIETKVTGDDITIPLEQAIPNGMAISELIANAFKHGFKSNNRGMIVIELENLRNTNVSIRVKNNGQPIPKGFNPFKSGSTLGLTLTKNLVEKQLHGTIEVVSRDWTEFIIEIPFITGDRANA